MGGEGEEGLGGEGGVGVVGGGGVPVAVPREEYVSMDGAEVFECVDGLPEADICR